MEVIIVVKTSQFSSLSLSELDLDPFPPEERYEVKVREGVGAVLICEPPYHYPGNSAHLQLEAWCFIRNRLRVEDKRVCIFRSLL